MSDFLGGVIRVTIDLANIASGGAINFGGGDVLLTHSSNALTLTGGDLFVGDGNGLVIGHAAQVTTDAAAEFQVLGTGLADSIVTIGRWSADASGPSLHFVKSRNAAIGSSTIVQDNDVLGGLYWHADDGTDFVNVSASFFAEVDDASPAANDIGTAFVWQTQAGGGGALTERMRLTAAGFLQLSTGGTFSAGGAPGLSINGVTDTGLGGNNENLAFWEGGTLVFNITSVTSQIRSPSGYVWSWSSAADNFAGADTGLSRASAGVVVVGNGTAADATGTIRAALVHSTGDSVIIGTSQTPASGGAGTQGEIAWDGSYLYVCTAANTWRRVATTGGY